MSEPLYLAKSEDGYPALLPQMANRHGLITGATGTGKTVTLQSIAERLSYAGVPVFMADVKGDLTGISQAGSLSPKLAERLKTLGLPEPTFGASPVTPPRRSPSAKKVTSNQVGKARASRLGPSRRTCPSASSSRDDTSPTSHGI